MKNIEVIVINPYTREITRKEISGNEEYSFLKEYYAIIKCKLVEVAHDCFSTNDVLYLNEEGLFDEEEFFIIRGRVFWGIGIVVGTDLTIDGVIDKSATTDLESIKKIVKFL